MPITNDQIQLALAQIADYYRQRQIVREMIANQPKAKTA